LKNIENPAGKAELTYKDQGPSTHVTLHVVVSVVTYLVNLHLNVLLPNI